MMSISVRLATRQEIHREDTNTLPLLYLGEPEIQHLPRLVAICPEEPGLASDWQLQLD